MLYVCCGTAEGEDSSTCRVACFAGESGPVGIFLIWLHTGEFGKVQEELSCEYGVCGSNDDGGSSSGGICVCRGEGVDVRDGFSNAFFELRFEVSIE